MKYFVKGISLILFLALLIVDAIEISGVGLCIAGSVSSMIEAHKEAAYIPLTDSIFSVISGIGVAVLLVVALVIIAEIVIKIVIYRKAIKEKAFKHFKTFSIVGMIELVVNTLAGILVVGLLANQYFYGKTDTLSSIALTLFLVKVFMMFWLILDLLSAGQCIKDGVTY
ncbi:MAG: hypothetical protein J6X66_12050 [Lachnospiraceae bacterium]|nr:hypothetical protein [Lachnospiraceae bacterium]